MAEKQYREAGMDPLLDFLLTITGLRIVLEAVGLLTLTLTGVAVMAVVAALWSAIERPPVTRPA